MKGLLLPAILYLAGCGRYADFTLPVPAATPRAVSWRWQAQPEPVLQRGTAEDVLNPSLARTGAGWLNLFSRFDGKTWHTDAAISKDGAGWQVLGAVLSPQAATWEASYIAANGHVLNAGNEFLYWYQAGPEGRTRLGLARSPDGRQWTKLPSPVLDHGPRGAWDEISLGDPYVIRQGDVFYLFYLGQDRARRQRLGVARSTDGVTWTKLRTNPILELGEDGNFDENGLGEPAVWSAFGSYWMLYTGRDRNEVRRMGLAQSRDGVRWRKLSRPVIAGEQSWNRKVVCDPHVEPDGAGGFTVWFGGGDVAHPAERVHGQIGVGRLIPE